MKRSKPVRGVVESAFKAKKYMAPLLVWHPAIVACFAAAYFSGSTGFDPGKHALVFDPRRDLEAPISAQQRREYQNRLEQLARSIAEDTGADASKWPQLAADPQLDAAGRPVLRLHTADGPIEVGLSRENIVNGPESQDIAQRLLLVRVREELLRKSSAKVASSDVHSDLLLLEELHHGRPQLPSRAANVVGTD
jgi:hypothetical protein